MAIPECLPWGTYQGGSESLNPFVLLSSCKYSCLKVSIHVRVAAMRLWCILLSPTGPKHSHSEVKTARNRSGELGLGKKDGWDGMHGKGCYRSCLMSESSLKEAFLFSATEWRGETCCLFGVPCQGGPQLSFSV